MGVFDGADHQIAIAVLEGVVRGTGIDFQFTIAPAPASEIEVPLRFVGRCARRAVELIAPHKLPAAGGLCRRGRGDQ